MKKIELQFKILLALLALTVVSCSKLPCKSASCHTTIDSLVTESKILNENLQQIEANKELVARFYQELFGDKNIEAIELYIDSAYIQHNPGLPDGKAALKEAAATWFKDAPKTKVDIRHLAADKDFVYIHTRSEMGSKVYSVIDIFRLENGMIIEHWDVIQEVPVKSANSHPMF